MTSIYLIRHTQAEGNLYRMMQGHWDGHVTKNGLRQIDALAERFRDVHLDAVYSSDLSRAVETAEAVTRYNNLPIIKDSRIREINLGPWEQEFFGNLVESEYESIKTFMFDSENWYHEGAETFSDVKKRAYNALEDIAKRHDGQDIAVVSHGVTIRCLLSVINDAPLTDIKKCPICKNTAVAHLLYENGKFECEYFNDISHLGKEDEYHWWKTKDIRDEIINVSDDEEYYKDCYQNAWAAAHGGDLSRFNADSYFDAAKSHIVYKLYDAQTPVGLVELSTRCANRGYGWICLLYIKEEFRGIGYGVQGLGRAIKLFRGMDLDSIRLHCASENTDALKFYEDYGFSIIDTESGAYGPLYLLERRIK